jgi:uncharacterized membrane protein
VDTIFGFPAHPLLVHIPVVLLPLAAVGVVVMAIRQAWYLRYRWAVLAVTAAGAIGAVFAAEAGDSLEERLRRAGEQNTWEDHAGAGETARTVALVFLVAVAAYVLIPWIAERLGRGSAAGRSVGAAAAESPPTRRLPRWVLPVLAVVTLAAGAASVVTVIDAGHSGAKSAWSDTGG